MPEMNVEERNVAELHRGAGAAAEEGTRWQDAVREYERCLSSLDTPEPPVEAAVLTALGRCYWNLSEAKPAWRALRRAISLYQQLGDGVGQARATVEILRIWGPPDRQRQMAEEALTALGDADPYLHARLLLRLRWFDEDVDEKFHEAMAIADRHGFDDLLVERMDQAAWTAIEEGRIDEAISLRDQAHKICAQAKDYDAACGTLRRSGFSTCTFGFLDRGFDLSQRAFDYAMSVNLNFAAQLALMDMVGVAFARGEFARCEELLALSPGDTDFRADLYRMWMAEEQGDIDAALRLMVSPERGGNATTAMGQLHAAAAGTLFRAGRHDAARNALQAWADVERGWEEDLCEEAPAMFDCLVALGSQDLVQRVYAAFTKRRERTKVPVPFSILQGRAMAPLEGALALRLGFVDEADRHYREGQEWCERERCLRDAERCRAGLVEARQRRSSPTSR